MKRILLLITVICAFVPGSVQARRYIPLRYRTRYSPYAFDTRHSGLVHGGVRYSPYAFNHNNSGLVHENVRYSPYAFNHNHSGLIADYCGYYAPCYFSSGPYYPDWVDYGTHKNTSICGSQNSSVDSARSCDAKKITRREEVRQLRYSRNKIRAIVDHDPKEIIRRYLQNKNLDGFRTDRLLRIDNKTLSVNFVFRDRNLIIKYWNTDEIEALSAESGYKRSYYDKYRKDWEKFCREYRQRGGNVYLIGASGEAGIVAGLELCPELNEGGTLVQLASSQTH